MVEELDDYGSLTVHNALENEGIRRIIRKPRETPRRIREDIAEILCREVILGEPYRIKDTESFVCTYGVFYYLFKYIRGTSEWEELIKISRRNNAISTLAFEFILDRTLGLLDEMYHNTIVGGEQVEGSLSGFLEVVRETMYLWNRRTSGTPPFTEMLNEPYNTAINEQAPMNREEDDHRVLNIEEQKPEPQNIDMRNEEEAPGDKSKNTIQYNEGEYKETLASLARPTLDETSGFVEEMKKHAEVLELLSALYPGRLWDYSLVEMHKKYLDNLSQYSKFLEKNEELQRIIELLGRIELESGSKRQAISSQGRTETYSVTTSKNIEYALPVEMAKLDDETMEYLFYQKYMEGKLLTYQLRGKYWVGGPPSKKRKGPVVALVDTSGSMHGSPELVAKSVILAVAKKMLKEKRDVKVVLFSSIGQTSEIELTNTMKMASEFLNFLNYTFGGGTDFNTALRSGLKSVKEKEYKSADLLFITDGLSSVSDHELLKEWDSFKKGNDTRVFTIIVGNNHVAGLEKVSDHTFILGENGYWANDASPGNLIELVCTK